MKKLLNLRSIFFAALLVAATTVASLGTSVNAA